MSCSQCELNLPNSDQDELEEGDSVTLPCCGTTWELICDDDESGLHWENVIDGEFEVRADTTGETRTDSHRGPLTEPENACAVAAAATENVGPKPPTQEEGVKR